MEKLLAGKMIFDLRPHMVMPMIEQAILENQAYADQYAVSFSIESNNDYVIVVDNQRLQQVLNNFLSNAAKFSNQNSRVDIRVTSDQGKVRISVQDYGQGIPVDFQKRIFQKFAQADASDARRRGGTGLGLSISKEMVERMGGQIGFASELNKGSVFFAEFPLILNDQESADA
jgi:signal transduction histidine kinase